MLITTIEPNNVEKLKIDDISMYAKKILQYAISISSNFDEITGFGDNNIIPVVLKEEDYIKIFGDNFYLFIYDMDKYRNELNNLNLSIIADLNKSVLFSEKEIPEAEISKYEPHKGYKEAKLSIETEPWILEQIENNTNKIKDCYYEEMKLVESVIWNKEAKSLKGKIGTIIFLNPQAKELKQRYPITDWLLERYYFAGHYFNYESDNGTLIDFAPYKRTECLIKDLITEDELNGQNINEYYAKSSKKIEFPELSDCTIKVLKYIFDNVDNNFTESFIVLKTNELLNLFEYYDAREIDTTIRELKESVIELRITNPQEDEDYIVKSISVRIANCVGGNYSNGVMEALILRLNHFILLEYGIVGAFLRKLNSEYLGVLEREKQKLQEQEKQRREEYEREKRREARKKAREKKKAKEQAESAKGKNLKTSPEEEKVTPIIDDNLLDDDDDDTPW